MNKVATNILYLVFGAAMIALGFSIPRWASNPIEPYAPNNSDSRNCTECHKNSIAFDTWEGEPDWHNEKFCNPILNSTNREEHRREAHYHRNECMSCHANNFQTKCANCHLESEW